MRSSIEDDGSRNILAYYGIGDKTPCFGEHVCRTSNSLVEA